jgi:ABC-2 type transport system permease protein
MLARAYPRVIGLRRMPGWIVMEVVLAILPVCGLGLVYRTMQAPPEFLGFVVLGGVMTAFWLNVLWSMGAQFYNDREAGNLEPYIMAPAPLMAILAGMALGGMLITALRAAVVLALGLLLFQVSFEPSSGWALAAVFLLTLLALYGLGMVFASVFLLWGREAWHIINALQEPVYLLAGLNFPVRVLGQVLPYAATLLPLTCGIDAMRQLLFPATAEHGLLPLWAEVAILALLAVAFLALARVCLARLERRARAEGRLTVRWQ